LLTPSDTSFRRDPRRRPRRPPALLTAWATSLLRGHRIAFCPPGWAILRDRDQIVLRPRRRRADPRGWIGRPRRRFCGRSRRFKMRCAPCTVKTPSSSARPHGGPPFRLPYHCEASVPTPVLDTRGRCRSSPSAKASFRFEEVRLQQRPLPPADAEKIARLALGRAAPLRSRRWSSRCSRTSGTARGVPTGKSGTTPSGDSGMPRRVSPG